MSSDQSSKSSCSMVGALGIFIQLGLGVLSFSVLIIKRLREKPRRPWTIWSLDTSKQLISQIIAHFINLTIALALASADVQSDQCLWYLTTNILDNTVGVLLCILTLKGIQRSLKQRGKHMYISGNYYSKEKVTVQVEIMDFSRGEVKQSIQTGRQIQEIQQKRKDQLVEQKMDEIDKQSRVSTIDSKKEGRQQTQTIEKYKIDYRSWLVQLLIWISVVVIGKSVIFGMQIALETPLKDASNFVLGWIESYPVLELILVMVIVPVIMNGFAFWIQDNFLKKKQEMVPEGETLLIQQSSQRRGGQL